MKHYKKIILTLALLLTAVTGAWAEEKMVTINSSTTSSGAVTATGFYIFENYLYINTNTATITTSEGVITKLVIKKGDLYGGGFTETNVGVTPGTITYGSDEITVTDINAESVTLSRKETDNWSTSSVDVYYGEPTEWPLTSKDGKNWILDKMPANNIELQVEYEPTKVTMAANDKTMGTVEVGGESKVEWTADTWKGWTSSTKTYTVDDITMTSTQNASIQEITEAGKYEHSLFFYVSQENNNSTVTLSTTGDPFSRIEFTMIDDYKEDYLVSNRWGGNPVIMPKDNWTFEGKSAVWEGEATKSLTLQSCTTQVSKITFFKGAVPDGVIVNTDGTFTVAKTATVTLTATPKEGYKFLYWEDDKTNTNPVREVTIESGMADKTYTAVFAEPTFNVTFVEGTNLNEWTATPNTEVKKDTKVDIKYNGTKKVLGLKVAKAADNTYLKWDADQKKLVATEIPAEATKAESSTEEYDEWAGTYVVEGDVTIREIGLSGNVELIIKDGAKLTVNNMIWGSTSYNLSIYGQAQMSGELVVTYSGEAKDAQAINGLNLFAVHSCKVKATSSTENCGGFGDIKTFNVYGGSVDAENTGTVGPGISLYNSGSMNIYGGDVKAVGKGQSTGINGGPATVKVYGGKLWAECAGYKALSATVTLTKDSGYTSGKIEYSMDNSTWSEAKDTEAKYVKVGY